MLQIKKKLQFFSLRYNFYTLQPKIYKKIKNIKKKKQSVISLRAPINFNVGKYKVYSLNNKLSSNFILIKNNSYINSFLDKSVLSYYNLYKNIAMYKLNKVKSVSILIKTTIKFNWLL